MPQNTNGMVEAPSDDCMLEIIFALRDRVETLRQDFGRVESEFYNGSTLENFGWRLQELDTAIHWIEVVEDGYPEVIRNEAESTVSEFEDLEAMFEQLEERRRE